MSVGFDSITCSIVFIRVKYSVQSFLTKRAYDAFFQCVKFIDNVSKCHINICTAFRTHHLNIAVFVNFHIEFKHITFFRFHKYHQPLSPNSSHWWSLVRRFIVEFVKMINPRTASSQQEEIAIFRHISVSGHGPNPYKHNSGDYKQPGYAFRLIVYIKFTQYTTPSFTFKHLLSTNKIQMVPVRTYRIPVLYSRSSHNSISMQSQHTSQTSDVN